MRGEIVYTSGRLELEPPSPDPEASRLVRGLARPFSEGVTLWARSLPSLCLRVALPVAAALGLLAALGFDAVRQIAAANAASLAGTDLSTLALLYAAALGVSLAGVACAGAQLSRMHLRGSASGSTLEAVKGFVP